MTPRSLQAVLRTLTATADTVSDAELLRRFQSGDEQAFADLVKRHGRLVWAVCRNLTGCESEADDAFQATFVVLLKNTGKIRDAAKLSSWLHGVAYKVCAKSRQGSRRRTDREKATASPEGNGTAVPESAWDRALAAVHEEAAKLPETLRVPFVLCCLEGKGVSDAADQLGWKLGTLSGRLTRAKDAILARLEARGLTAGVVVAVGVAMPPAALMAKVVSLTHVGSVVPGSILQLTQGVLGMSMKSVKMLAATVLLACGLGLGVGSGLVATAEGQAPKPGGKPDVPSTPIADAKIQQLNAELERARAELALAAKKLAEKAASDEAVKKLVEQVEGAKLAEAERQALRAMQDRELKVQQALALAQKKLAEELASQDAKNPKTVENGFATNRYEYALVKVTMQEKEGFARLLNEWESRGYDYAGTSALKNGTELFWTFRRPNPAAKGQLKYYYQDAQKADPGKPLAEFTKPGADSGKPKADPLKPGADSGKPKADPGKIGAVDPSSAKPGFKGHPNPQQEAMGIEEEIARLQKKLVELKAGQAVTRTVTFEVKSTPLDQMTLANVLQSLGSKKFKRFSVTLGNDSVTVTGDEAALIWANTFVESLKSK